MNMSTSDEKIFQAYGLASRAMGGVGRTVFGRLLRRLTPTREEDLGWAGDADLARLQQEPLRARSLLNFAAVTLLLLLFWAAMAHVDEVTRGEGKVVPTRQLQVIQSFDGGVVQELAVKEGQIVQAGDLLLRIDSTRFESGAQENRVTLLALQAKALRLQALTQGTPFLPSLQLMKEAGDVVEAERRLYESRRSEITAQISIAQSQLAQRQQELSEVRARRDQAARGFELTQQEYNATKPLVKSGAVSEVEILRLERDLARLRGDRDQAAAQIERVQEAINEATRKIQEVELTSRNQMRTELGDTMSKIASLTQGSRALADKVKLSEIKSPVRGTIKRLLVNTVGGVVLPGKEVVEIVPLDEALILEARIRPQDIGFLRPGQEALVKFTAYDFAVYGGLAADLEQIGADSITDDKGNSFYVVRLRTRKTTLGENLPIIPGMVAEVDILTGKKTVLSYLMKPVLRAKANALSEK
jgi:adhesin transport system membrane fusion protein